MNKLKLIIILASLVLACGKSDRIFNPRLFLIPPTINIGPNRIAFNAHMARDLMPSIPSDGAPIQGVIELYDNNLLPIPESCRADSMWIVYHDFVGPASLQEFDQSEAGDTVWAAIIDGPCWGRGESFDVVVKLLYNHNVYYLKATNQKINIVN